MGTVLHLADHLKADIERHSSFSPLLDGDGVASGRCAVEHAAVILSFSPLLDGDGVASREVQIGAQEAAIVSVPFSMGTVLHRSSEIFNNDNFAYVSVPFSMGTVLHRADQARPECDRRSFQSPSRWGRCCIGAAGANGRGQQASFSPLLDGDGVASASASRATVSSLCCFSPLLDGDGVASCWRYRSSVPSDGRVASTPCDVSVSVPFSMGTVLHPLLNSHILQHLYCVREALSSQIRFLRRKAPNLRILSLPYVSAIVCVLAFFTPLPHVCRLRQAPV